MSGPAADFKVIGADELSASMSHASRELEDFSDPGSKAVSLIGQRGRVEAPKLTGRLASSLSTTSDAHDAEITSALPYANRVHYGYARYGQQAQPFLLRPAYQLVDVWFGYYEDEAARVLHKVKGA